MRRFSLMCTNWDSYYNTINNNNKTILTGTIIVSNNESPPLLGLSALGYNVGYVLGVVDNSREGVVSRARTVSQQNSITIKILSFSAFAMFICRVWQLRRMFSSFLYYLLFFLSSLRGQRQHWLCFVCKTESLPLWPCCKPLLNSSPTKPLIINAMAVPVSFCLCVLLRHREQY